MKNYENIIEKIQELKLPEIEKNIFSIGGRGHYENPISDIFAFFIDPKEEHGFGKLFLQSLFEAAGEDEPLLELTEIPNREQYTESGNRIDLIAEGDNWVLTIENKIRHMAINPFEDYQSHIEKQYSEKKIKVYILLTIKNMAAPTKWVEVTYKSFVERVKSNIGSHLLSACSNKWHVILREFILNIETEYGDNIMSNERIDFARTNYSEMLEMQDMLNEYIEHMKNEGSERINSIINLPENTFVKHNDWRKEGIALRFHPKVWGNSTNIALILRRDGSFRIQFYVYDISDNEISNLKNHIDTKKYKNYWTEKKTIRCFGFIDSPHEKIVFREISDLAEKLNAFYAL